MRNARDDRGAVAVEVAVLAPALVALMLLVVFAGRVSHADGEVRRAASEAARAASLRQSPEAAVEAARATAASNLADSGFVCDELTTSVDTAQLVAGGRVSVSVRCVADMSDVTMLGVPGTRTFESRSVEVIDRYRGGEP
ncbi:MAG: TadE/TadG family type IV pilus assembly protein [Acidimicrobiia bacterium]